MSVGLTLTKADLDQRAASVFIGLRDNLRRCSELNALLNDTTIIANDAALTTMGYSTQEISWLRGAFTDTGGTGVSLYRIAIGAVAGPGAPNDFFFNAKHLSGFITS
jgi:hypothetical protein